MTGSILLRSMLGLALGTSFATAAWAQQADQQQADQQQQTQQQSGQDQARQQDRPEIIALATWRYDELYDTGFSVEQLMDDYEVRGTTGEEIGNVENVIFDADDRIVAIVAEVGGFWDIGDTHVSVPADQAEINAAEQFIRIPVSEDNVDDYSIYGQYSLFTQEGAENTRVVDDDLLTGPRLWKATEVLDDYALLSDHASYGYVDDLILGDDGKVQAVVVTTRSGYGVGPYAYPFYGYSYGNRPGDPYYNIQYEEADVANRERFDLSRMANRNEEEG
jgi:sporulation protein YlmC with PRC-barrel domain